VKADTGGKYAGRHTTPVYGLSGSQVNGDLLWAVNRYNHHQLVCQWMFQRRIEMKNTIWLMISLFIMTVSCQPVPTALPPISNPLPTATAALPPAFTVTIKGKECTFAGPMRIPFGEFTIKLVIEKQKISEMGYALITIDEGKTLDDLKGSNAAQPDWAHRLAGEHKFEGTSSRAFDLANMPAFYKGEPFYVVCFWTDPDLSIRQVIGAFGPIEVEK
jgi:hypothetical protein